ncbi:MAG TPA: nuclear transport factor 2 family protein [Bryobacteraceae bacterium]|nr:nuclear transport factor 2 family protein [Bryobacteraceae bacterium]
MSVSIVKELYAAFSRGDIQAILARVDQDVVWEMEAPPIISFGGIRRGIAETAGFFEGLAKDHTGPQLDMTEFLESGDAVAAFGRYEATMRISGKLVNSPVAHYFKFRDGKIVRYQNFVNTAAFVEAMQPEASAAGR